MNFLVLMLLFWSPVASFATNYTITDLSNAGAGAFRQAIILM